MKFTILNIGLYLFVTIGLCSSVNAQIKDQDRTATIRGKSEVLITKQKINLSDIAEITAQNPEAQLALSKIELASSPKPGATLELSAQRVLEVLRNQGVDLQKVGYVLAPNITIRRASRSITEPEIQAALQATISQEGNDIAIKSISLPRDPMVFAGPANIQASLRAAGNGTQRNYEIVLTNAEGDKMTLEGRVELDSWKQVPVATRSISAGSIVGAPDFGLARLNTKDLPKDAAYDGSDLLGKMVQRDVAVGQVFRVGTLERPAVIKSGSRVTLLVNSGLLEATATGIAMQDGFNGDIIEVRNDSSRRVVSGRVKDQTTVEILQ